MLRKTFPWDGIVPAIEVRLLAPLSLITAVRELHFICLKFSCHFSEALDWFQLFPVLIWHRRVLFEGCPSPSKRLWAAYIFTGFSGQFGTWGWMVMNNCSQCWATATGNDEKNEPALPCKAGNCGFSLPPEQRWRSRSPAQGQWCCKSRKNFVCSEEPWGQNLMLKWKGAGSNLPALSQGIPSPEQAVSPMRRL